MKMVSWSGNEIELLLKLVHERETLYDVSNEDYTNRDIVWALWTDIAMQLNKTPTACRDKWTSLRCVYRRIINQQASSKTKRKIKWPWAHLMTFLIPHLKTIQPRYPADVEIDDSESVIALADYKTYSANGANGNNFVSLNNFSEDFEINDTVGNSEDGVAEYLYYDSSTESDLLEEQSMNKPSLKRIKKEETSQLKSHGKNVSSRNNSKYEVDRDDEYLNDIQAEEYYQTQKMTNLPMHFHQCDQLAGADADEMFFRSIVPDVKLLNPKDKGTFKIKVQQLLHEMLYSSKEDTAILESHIS